MYGRCSGVQTKTDVNTSIERMDNSHHLGEKISMPAWNLMSVVMKRKSEHTKIDASTKSYTNGELKVLPIKMEKDLRLTARCMKPRLIIVKSKHLQHDVDEKNVKAYRN